jgi:outer membrane protein assembly factor BamD
MVLMLSGCAVVDRFLGDLMHEEKSPAEIMAEGTQDLKEGNYERAKESFQKITDRYPYSKFAVEAELKMADALYKSEAYEEAYDAYVEFEKLHPKNPNIPYVLYQRGMCHFEQVHTIDRDQSHTQMANTEFKRLVERFPKTVYADKARGKIRECYIALADHELYVGRYYYKQGKYRAAMGRYRYLLDNYPDLGQYHEALEFLSRCKARLADKKGKP